ncbi:hypothetical protein O3M35_012945 [Rhynocoris fuscipes]|uniref:mitogen-activated protein kinase kinase n=1 Tax=Rhynocoris fuscipes TaxID=488301 RepID=A0AAW1CKS3_9HEMI
MVHIRSNTEMAVKRIRSTVDEKEQKQLLMDLDVVMKSNDCSYIVKFYGALFKEGDCWICMELMDTSLDKFYKYIYDHLHTRIPESILGKISVAPERIDPQRGKSGYDVRSDVWSLGITLMEVATGKFPYPKWKSVFDQLYQVVNGNPPTLRHNYQQFEFSPEFISFVDTWLVNFCFSFAYNNYENKELKFERYERLWKCNIWDVIQLYTGWAVHGVKREVG